MVYNTNQNKEIVNKVCDVLNANKNAVVCVCYGTAMLFKNSQDAKRYFKECILCSDGCEQERYTTIYFKIDDGWRVADDDADNIEQSDQLIGATEIDKKFISVG